jgi:hypothetical protein
MSIAIWGSKTLISFFSGSAVSFFAGICGKPPILENYPG